MDVVPVAIVPPSDPGVTGREPARPEEFPDLWAMVVEILGPGAAVGNSGVGEAPDLPGIVEGAGEAPSEDGDLPETGPDGAGVAVWVWGSSPRDVPRATPGGKAAENVPGVSGVGDSGLPGPSASTRGTAPEKLPLPPAEESADAPSDGPKRATDPRAERLWGFWLRRARGGPAAGAAKAIAQGGGPEGSRECQTLAETRAGMGHEGGPAALPAPEAEDRAVRSTERIPHESDPKPGAPAAAPAKADQAAPAKVSPNRPEAPHPPPAVDQVTRAVRVAIRSGSDRVTVQLEPEHLGRVHVEVTREAGGLTAHIRVENAQAHQLLLNEIPALRAAAETRQVPLVHVAVEFDHGDGRPGDRPEPRRRGRRGPALEPGEDELGARTAWMPWGFETRI